MLANSRAGSVAGHTAADNQITRRIHFSHSPFTGLPTASVECPRNGLTFFVSRKRAFLPGRILGRANGVARTVEAADLQAATAPMDREVSQPARAGCDCPADAHRDYDGVAGA